jgi:hypothetical protein
LKNPGDPSVSAVCSNVPGKTPPIRAFSEEKSGGAEREGGGSGLKDPENSSVSAGFGGQGRPNGHDPDSERRPSTIEAQIFEEKAKNPTRSAAWIGKRVGRPASVVRRILANNANLPEGGAS